MGSEQSGRNLCLRVSLIATLLLVVTYNIATESARQLDKAPTPVEVYVPNRDVGIEMPFEKRAYENNTLGCTVQVVQVTDETLPSRDTLEPMCTQRLIDEFFLSTGQFHGEGTWYVSNFTDPDESIQYVPSLCSFASTLNTRRKQIPKCFQEKKIRKILITGDSNGRHFKDELVHYLEHAKYSCTEVRSTLTSEDGVLVKNDSYLDVPGVPHEQLHLPNNMFAKDNWAFKEYNCKKARSIDADVLIEFIHGSRFPDPKFYLQPKSSGLNFEERVYKAESDLEYLVKYYYPYYGFPDLWYYTLPFHNVAISTSSDMLRLKLKTLLGLLDIFLPNTTRVVFVADATICPDERMENYVHEYQRHWNMTMDEEIHDMNQVFYEELSVEMPGHDNYHVFLDATRVACPVTCTWHHDPAHMLPVWYYKMAEYNFDILCAE